MFWLVFLGLVAIILSLHYLYLTFVTFKYWKRRGVAHETPKYPLGNITLSQIFSIPTQELLQTIYNKIEGPFLGFMVHTRPALIVKDPELINRILVKDFHYFKARIELDVSHDPLLGSMFILNDERWKIFRQRLSPIFAPNRIRDIFESIEKKYDIFEEFIAHKKTINVTLDFYKITKRYLVDVMAALILGIDVDYVNNPNDQIRLMSEEALPPTGRTAFSLFITFLAPRIKKMFHYTFYRKEVIDFAVSLVESVMKFRDKKSIERFDYLQKLMEMRQKDNTTGHSTEVLAAQVLLLILAGYEATGTSLAFCLWQLAKNPNVQRKAQEEVDRVFEEDGKLTFESLIHISMQDNFLSDSLRLHAPLTFLMRECHEDYTYEKHNIVIEKGTSIVVPLPGLHRDEQYYPNANEFNPNRFLPEEKAKRPSGTYLPFGDGQRFCFGKQLAKTIHNYTVGNLLHKYNLELIENPTKDDFKYKPMTPLLHPIGGTHIRLVERH